MRTLSRINVQEVVANHFFHPRNVGDAGEPSFTGRSASLSCGALVRVSIQVDEAHSISQARFRAAGCDVLIAAASVLTEKVQGISTAEAAGVEAVTLSQQIGTEKVRC